MDLRSHILSLVAPAGLGDELLPGVRLLAVTTELGPRLTVSAGGDLVHIEIEPLDPERPAATRTERLMLSYRPALRGTGFESERGLALCRAIAAIVAPREAEVLASMAEDAARVTEGTGAEARVAKIREVQVDKLFEPVVSSTTGFYSLSPYVGCLIGCRFCYADSRVAVTRRMESLPAVPWGSYVDVRVNAPEILAREVATLAPGPVKFCPIVSDPYHVLERSYRLTRRCLEVLAAAPGDWPTLLLTRSNLILRDIDVITAIPRAWVGVSIPTLDDSARRHFEPRGATVDERLDVLRQFRALGVPTTAVVQPMLPGPVNALADALAETTTSVRIDVLHGVQGAAREFGDPRFAIAADPEWQMTQALALRDALIARGVAIWTTELPPELDG